jgi:hypothetical protein
MRSDRLAFVGVLVLVLAGAEPATAADRPSEEADLTLTLDEGAAPLLVEDLTAAAPAEGAPPEGEPKEPASGRDRWPVPFHTIEGYGGTNLVPMAYLLNPGKPGDLFGMPSFSYGFSTAGDKNLHTFAVSITLLERLELSWGVNRAGFKDLEGDILAATRGFRRAERDHVWMHNINLRGLIVEETMALPAVTGGVHFKINEGIHEIDDDLGAGAGFGLRNLGFEKASGVDFTLTASKTFPHLLCDRPLIATAGLRWSQASQIGWAGFGDAYRTSWEGSLVWLPRDDIAAGYEYRMRRTAYARSFDLNDGEDDWHLLFVAWAIDEHLKLVGRWMYAGEMANTDESCVWGLQVQYDF